MRGEDLLSTLEPYFTDGLSVNDIDKVTVLHDIFEKDFFTFYQRKSFSLCYKRFRGFSPSYFSTC